MNKTRYLKGFTLIEMVVVIVMLGILIAAALPRFVDLNGEAEREAVKSIAGTLTAAANLNYSARIANAVSWVAISDSTDACTAASDSVWANAASLLNGSFKLVKETPAAPDEFAIIGGSTFKACSSGIIVQCLIVGMNGKTASTRIPCTN